MGAPGQTVVVDSSRRSLLFPSADGSCTATHVPGRSDAFNGPAGRPCVVMAHGFGGTTDTGLPGYVDGLAAAGLDVLAFDYRGFGASAGEDRQVVSWRAQREDYRAAVAAARSLPGVDPDRIVLWGTSYSGGHVLTVAADDSRVAAVVALDPAMDGAAALLMALRREGPLPVLALTAHALVDRVGSVLGRAPHLVPLTASPGSVGFLTAPGAVEGYTSVAGPLWRNEVAAREALDISMNRPSTVATRVACPVLVQVAEGDRTVSTPAARRTAEKVRDAEVVGYDIDHFDVYADPWLSTVLADQVAFLGRRLGA